MNATVDPAATLLLQYNIRDVHALIPRGLWNGSILLLSSFGLLRSFSQDIGHIHNRTEWRSSITGFSSAKQSSLYHILGWLFIHKITWRNKKRYKEKNNFSTRHWFLSIIHTNIWQVNIQYIGIILCLLKHHSFEIVLSHQNYKYWVKFNH